MTVYLVGAGPGDPELLTRRAAALLSKADVVVTDRLVDPRVLALVRPAARIVDVGKRPRGGDPSAAQAAINRLLIDAASTRECVVRLKGGDPFVFGRGAEELDALRTAGIDVEVVPGVSSSLAVPALAGIPVTLRDVASSVTIASGHRAHDGPGAWEGLARTGGTLVLLMAVDGRAEIADQLIAGGLDATTPVAIVERGATPTERRVSTTLGCLGDTPVAAPAVIVVGEVARLMVPIREEGITPLLRRAGTPQSESAQGRVGRRPRKVASR